MADEMNGEREAFEAWLPKVWSRATVTDSEGDTSYADEWVQGAFVGFCAGRASLAANAGSEPVAPDGWPAWCPEAVSALVMLDRMDVGPDDDARVDAVSAIVRSMADKLRPSPPEGMAGWKPIETAPKYTEHGVRRHLMLGYAPDENYEDGFVSQGYWMEAEEDAPDNMGHDGGWVDVHFDFFSCGRSFGDEAYRTTGTQPTHWQPLPAPPLASEVKETS